MESIKERSVTNEEMGMFWRDTELSYWWYPRPDRDAGDDDRGVRRSRRTTPQAVEDCKVWLLKQKQTQDWKTTKAHGRRGLRPAPPRRPNLLDVRCARAK